MKMDLVPARFFIEDLLPQGLCILASPPKYGKSWLVLDLCLSVSSGEPFFGRPVDQAACIYFALEDSLARLKDRVQKIWKDKPLPKDFYIQTQAPNLDNGLVGEIEKHLELVPTTKIVVLDTLQKIRGASLKGETAYVHDYRELGVLQQLAIRLGICIIVVHHVRKMKDDTDVFAGISGTHGITGAADTSMVMQKSSRDSQETTLHVTGRDVEETMLVLKMVNGKWEFQGTYTNKFFDLIKSVLPFYGTMTELMKKAGIDTDDENNQRPAISFGMKFGRFKPLLADNGIKYTDRRTNNSRGFALDLVTTCTT